MTETTRDDARSDTSSPVSSGAPVARRGPVHPDWSRTATIYQINTRQFTPEGTIAAAAAHLPRLQALGVSILWLMPVHEIGRHNRKGSLGSPYAVRDYYTVNSELGTLDDLRGFVDAAHALGMRVILDWVANHTAWDNPLVIEHPDWFARTADGHLVPTPWWDWDDIVDLDYTRADLRRWMTDAMRFWVVEADVDGYRCDTAGFVPLDFWEEARRELETVKPVFMLAEWETRDLHSAAFDASYAWTWTETVQRISQGAADVSDLRVYYAWNEKAWPRDAMRMTCVTNHDMNAWDGTEFERFGDALPAAVVLAFVGEGMPLVHNGSEAGNQRRLAFFERDPIEWREHPMGELYRELIDLKRRTSALWNGAWGARMIEISNDCPDRVLSFLREDSAGGVLAVLNLSPQARTVALDTGKWRGHVSTAASGLADGLRLDLPAWGHRLLTT